ncbi:bacillithiol biosynthesis cysteine-adding enzyme BshC [Sporosarcina saromensis]|uniref:Putative cysteine ligase BshC n=1 Tax=Sporosarcina saromensis TaxID=359365 RepID=A0ABU4G4H2_9BACL|nr:bacillithiol biosynthesis cysteine-adding enzyme BshC [Sporosarcina saromensis]MDW0111874.1 bacillithiol biosynthesis cysteine-adding enzyme BshC [Sporosarcina saromensis]
MEFETLELHNQNKVLQAYMNEEEFIHTFFDYKNEHASFPKRVEELTGRTFDRKEIASVIRSYMESFGISDRAAKHIDELANDAVVVIGGQQAGLLTGPLYSIHKALTVILLAASKRRELDLSVVPVFWVAGEDHDLNEINHVFVEKGGKPTKQQYQEKFVLKLMASDTTYTEQEMIGFVEEIFRQFGETNHTKPLLHDVIEAVKMERTFTGFFVRLMNGLFKEQGLLFIDSAFKPLRQLESKSFQAFIREASTLTASIIQKEKQFESLGFDRPIQLEEDAANLFFVHETGRFLLSKVDGIFINESAGIRYTEEQLLEIAREQPWLLSNNVATRPIMQDLVFPVLAFVGGPGEIAYWAQLKEAFHHLNVKMPILVPRISITLVSQTTQQLLKECSFSIEDVLAGAVHETREQFITTQKDEAFELALCQIEHHLDESYQELSRHASAGMQQLLSKNVRYHKQQFGFLRKKAEEEVFIQHEATLRKYRKIENEILPNGSLQERLYTPYLFMNEFGPDLVQKLLQLPLEPDGNHKIVYL